MSVRSLLGGKVVHLKCPFLGAALTRSATDRVSQTAEIRSLVWTLESEIQAQADRAACGTLGAPFSPRPGFQFAVLGRPWPTVVALHRALSVCLVTGCFLLGGKWVTLD